MCKKNIRNKGKSIAVALVTCLLLLSGCGWQKKDGTDLFQYLAQEREMEKQKQGYSGVDNPVILNLAHSSDEGTVVNRIALRFKENVENYSRGTIQVDIYPEDSLGYVTDYNKALSINTVDAWIGSGAQPIIQVLHWMPTLQEASLEEMEAVLASPEVSRQLSEEASRGNVLVKNLFPIKFRYLTCNEPVQRVEDFQGLTMRCYSSRSHEKGFWEALGADTAVYDIHELYAVLQQKLVDGEENTIPVIMGNRLYEQQKYIIPIQHQIYFDGLYLSSAFYDSLTEEQKESIDLACNELDAYANSAYEAEQSVYQRILDVSQMEELALPDTVRQQMQEITEPYVEKSLRSSVGDEDVDLVLDSLAQIKGNIVE